MTKKFGNIGVLDLRDTTDTNFTTDYQFGNIGVVLYSKQSAHLLKNVKAGNIGSSIECDEKIQLIQGKSILGSELLGNLKEPLRLLVMGKLVVMDDLDPEALDRGLESIQISGKLVCPTSLLPTIQAKVISVNGKIETYPSGYKLYEKNLRLDRTSLQTIKPGSMLAVMADVSIEKDVPADLLNLKISGLFVKGHLRIPEQLLETVTKITHSQSPATISVIPSGFEVITDAVQVTATELALWEDANLFFSGAVRFADDLQASDIENIGRFVASEEVYCRESLLKTLASKCDRFKTKFFTYKDRLFLNDGQTELTQSFLSTAGTVTVINEGVLTFDPSVSANEINTKIDRIRNSGVLMVSDHQMGAVQTKAKESTGPIVSSTSNQGDSVGNIGVLKL